MQQLKAHCRLMWRIMVVNMVKHLGGTQQFELIMIIIIDLWQVQRSEGRGPQRTVMFADDIIICAESREQVVENLREV